LGIAETNDIQMIDQKSPQEKVKHTAKERQYCQMADLLVDGSRPWLGITPGPPAG